MLRTNKAGIDLIKFSEGFRAKPYLCPAGIPSIGYGSTYYSNGVKVTLKDPPITEPQALALLTNEVDEKEEILYRYFQKIKFSPTENQFSALMCFAYNCGCAPIVEGGRSLNIAIKSGMVWKIADAFLLYCKAKNKLGMKVEVAGLKKRRQAERELFLRK